RHLYSNGLTTLPERIFQNTTGLQTLYLAENELTTLPEGIFGGLAALGTLHLYSNGLTTLPEGIFQNTTGLQTLYLSENELTTLPEGIFGSLTAVEILSLANNDLTTLPEGVFQGLSDLTTLWLDGNALECLPSTTLVEVDDDVSDGLHVDAYGDECGCSITGVVDNVCGEETCTPGDEGYTCAATLVPAPTPALGTVAPGSTPLPTLAPGSGSKAATLAPAATPALGTAAPTPAPGSSSQAATLAPAATPPLGTAAPGSTSQPTQVPGSSSEAATPAPAPTPALGTAAPGSTPLPRPAPGSGSEAATLAPAATPALGTAAPGSTPQPTQPPASSSEEGASTVDVVVGVVAGALALAALGFFLHRRRAAKSTDPDPPAPPSNGWDNLEHGRGEQHQQRQQDLHPSSPIIAGSAGGNVTRGPPPPAQEMFQSFAPPPPSYAHDNAHRHDAWPVSASQQHAVIAAETTLGEDGTTIQSLFPAPPVGALPKPSSEGKPERTRDNNESGGGTRTADAGGGGRDTAEDGDGCVAAAEQSLLPLTTTNSTNEVSTEERTAEVAGFGFSVDEGADGPPSAAAPAGRRQTSSGVGYGQAVLAAAEELAHHCQIPGISEAATAVSILIHLVVDTEDLTSSAGVKRCRSIVMMLERAAKVLGKGGDTSTEEERVLMEEVHDAVSDLVELITSYQNKSKLGKVLTSTLFKRRQDELNAVIDRAIWGLHLGLQVQVGHDVAHLVKRSTAEAQAQAESLAQARAKEESLAQAQARAESLAETLRSRRQRKLDQIEIPEDHVSITTEVLGKGGFGVVYLADYNGHNAAAKVQHFTHGLGKPGENNIPLSEPRSVESNAPREKAERKAFLRELDAMIRLRNPHTVNVYGAITSLPDRLVLVMELLAGGDLRAMLKNSEQPLPEDKCRQIIQDVCAGMAFLHSKATVHGDLKSANVLLDGRGRAKIGDFGTSRWAQNTERSTGLATYTTNPGPSAHISFAWTAPEV
ncbi:unnamed protein product, partial [Ectocarpus sp. 8 AP-2014]